MKKFDSHAIVSVQLEDGDEVYEIWIGGDVMTYFSHGKLKAFVMKNPVDKS
jgi:hypothetical protein